MPIPVSLSWAADTPRSSDRPAPRFLLSRSAGWDRDAGPGGTLGYRLRSLKGVTLSPAIPHRTALAFCHVPAIHDAVACDVGNEVAGAREFVS
jgi:hypothetical protein